VGKTLRGSSSIVCFYVEESLRGNVHHLAPLPGKYADGTADKFSTLGLAKRIIEKRGKGIRWGGAYEIPNKNWGRDLKKEKIRTPQTCSRREGKQGLGGSTVLCT